jgi:ribosome maturation factor RimP
VEIVGNPRAQHVRVYLDKVGGIGILDLKAASEEISTLMDVENPIAGHFTLEVSSPGIDRPLRTEADFLRAKGRCVHVQLSTPQDGQSAYTGTLLEAGPDSVTLDLEGRPTAIALASIARAHVEATLGRKPRPTNDKRTRRVHG